MRESVVIYKSFVAYANKLDDQEYRSFMNAIFEYALDDKEPNLIGQLEAVFELVRPQLDANSKRYENGKKGGRPKTAENFENTSVDSSQKTKAKPNHNQTETKAKPNVNVNVNVNDNENENGVGFEQTDIWSLSHSVLSFLNDQAGTDYKTDDVDHVRMIAELVQKGYTEEEMKIVIENKVDDWLGDAKVEQYLRPKTLFKPDNFAQYLAQPNSARKVEKKKQEQKVMDQKVAGKFIEKAEQELKSIQEEIGMLDVRNNPEHFKRRQILKDREVVLQGEIEKARMVVANA